MKFLVLMMIPLSAFAYKSTDFEKEMDGLIAAKADALAKCKGMEMCVSATTTAFDDLIRQSPHKFANEVLKKLETDLGTKPTKEE